MKSVGNGDGLARSCRGTLRAGRSNSRRVDPAAGAPDRLAFQDAADLADLADLLGRDPPDDRPAIRQQVDDPDPRQRDQRLADRRVAHAEPLGQGLRDQMLPGPQRPWTISRKRSSTTALRRIPCGPSGEEFIRDKAVTAGLGSGLGGRGQEAGLVVGVSDSIDQRMAPQRDSTESRYEPEAWSP